MIATAKFANAPVELENVNWGDKSRAELRKNSQTGTFPYLHTPHGVLSEAYAIVQYIAANYNKALLGANAWEEALVNQWVQFSHLEILRHSKYTIYHLFGFYEYNATEANKSIAEVKESLQYLNAQLEGKSYIVGESYTLADLELFFALRAYFQLLFTEDVRKNIQNVTNWFTTLAANEHIVAAYGRTLLAKVAQQTPKVEKTLVKIS